MENLQSGDRHKALQSLLVYMMCALSVFVTTAARCWLEATLSLRAATNLHDELSVRVMQAPCGWFDTTPIGRLINRFSQDISTVVTVYDLLLTIASSHLTIVCC